MSKRNSTQRTYVDTKEVLFTGKKLGDLKAFLATEFELKEDCEFKIVKHIAHAFEWRVLDPDDVFTEKKKKTERILKLADLPDLKMNPI